MIAVIVIGSNGCTAGVGVIHSIGLVRYIVVAICGLSLAFRCRITPVIGHSVRRYGLACESPLAYQCHVVSTHGLLTSDNCIIQLPAAEGIGTIYVSVLIFRVNSIARMVGGINCVALAGHIAIPVRRQRHAIRYVLRAPVIGHLVHINIHIGAIIQLSVVKVALFIFQASLCISCIVRVIPIALIEGGVGIYLDGEANHQLLASPRTFIIDYRMAAIVKPADIDCLSSNRDCNVACSPF